MHGHVECVPYTFNIAGIHDIGFLDTPSFLHLLSNGFGNSQYHLEHVEKTLSEVLPSFADAL